MNFWEPNSCPAMNLRSWCCVVVGWVGGWNHFKYSTSAKAKQFHQKSVGDMICSLAMSCDLRTTKISLHESELHPICTINKLLIKEGYKIHHFLIKNIDNYGQHQHEILYSARGLPTTFKLLLALLASLLPLIKWFKESMLKKFLHHWYQKVSLLCVQAVMIF